MAASVWFVLAILLVALTFDFINGFHDAANSIATVVSTRVLSPSAAVVWAAFWNFVAAFVFGTAIAKTVGKGLIDLNVVDSTVVLGGLTGAIVWDLVTWWLGLPTSSSHALIGGYAGAAVAKAGFSAIIASGWTKTLIFIVVAPVMGFMLALLLTVALSWALRRSLPRRVDKSFRVLQLVSAALYSLGHGTNDAQKTMGIIVALLVSSQALFVNFPIQLFHLTDAEHIPPWVIVAAGAAIGLDDGGRLADREDDGPAHHEAHPVRGLLRRDSGSNHALRLLALRHPREYDAHDHRRDHGRRRSTALLCRALGRGGTNRVGVDRDDSGGRRRRRAQLLAAACGGVA